MSKSFIVKSKPPLPWEDDNRVVVGLRQALSHARGEASAMGKVRLTTRCVPIKVKPLKVVSVKIPFALSEADKAKIRGLATQRWVYVSGSAGKNLKKGDWPVFAATIAAEALGVSSITLANWIKAGQMPAAILHRTDTAVGTFYHVEEILAIAELLLEHQNTFKYYRKDHIDLRQKLSAAVEKVRARVFA